MSGWHQVQWLCLALLAAIPAAAKPVHAVAGRRASSCPEADQDSKALVLLGRAPPCWRRRRAQTWSGRFDRLPNLLLVNPGSAPPIYREQGLGGTSPLVRSSCLCAPAVSPGRPAASIGSITTAACCTAAWRAITLPPPPPSHVRCHCSHSLSQVPPRSSHVCRGDRRRGLRGAPSGPGAGCVWPASAAARSGHAVGTAGSRPALCLRRRLRRAG